MQHVFLLFTLKPLLQPLTPDQRFRKAADSYALGISPAKITFNGNSAITVQADGLIRTGLDTISATVAFRLDQDYPIAIRLPPNGSHRTGLDAGGLFTIETNHGGALSSGFVLDHLHPRIFVTESMCMLK
jgi:hypothetical protein